jgi:hypothetical protein
MNAGEGCRAVASQLVAPEREARRRKRRGGGPVLSANELRLGKPLSVLRASIGVRLRDTPKRSNRRRQELPMPLPPSLRNVPTSRAPGGIQRRFYIHRSGMRVALNLCHGRRQAPCLRSEKRRSEAEVLRRPHTRCKRENRAP